MGSNEADLESLNSSESGSLGKFRSDSKKVGAHFRRNCKESNVELRVRASGFSAIESIIGLRTLFMRLLLSDSGSFSQSIRAPSASGVEIVAGSLR